jgi:hypothetical protein
LMVPGSPAPTAAMAPTAFASAIVPGPPPIPGAVGAWLPGSPQPHGLGTLGGAWLPTLPPETPGGVGLGFAGAGGHPFGIEEGEDEEDDEGLPEEADEPAGVDDDDGVDADVEDLGDDDEDRADAEPDPDGDDEDDDGVGGLLPEELELELLGKIGLREDDSAELELLGKIGLREDDSGGLELLGKIGLREDDSGGLEPPGKIGVAEDDGVGAGRTGSFDCALIARALLTTDRSMPSKAAYKRNCIVAPPVNQED